MCNSVIVLYVMRYRRGEGEGVVVRECIVFGFVDRGKSMSVRVSIWRRYKSGSSTGSAPLSNRCIRGVAYGKRPRAEIEPSQNQHLQKNTSSLEAFKLLGSDVCIRCTCTLYMHANEARKNT